MMGLEPTIYRCYYGRFFLLSYITALYPLWRFTKEAHFSMVILHVMSARSFRSTSPLLEGVCRLPVSSRSLVHPRSGRLTDWFHGYQHSNTPFRWSQSLGIRTHYPCLDFDIDFFLITLYSLMSNTSSTGLPFGVRMMTE